jgi:hypothetical protein
MVPVFCYYSTSGNEATKCGSICFLFSLKKETSADILTCMQVGNVHNPQRRARTSYIWACLEGLRLHQTNSGAAAPPICSSTVELDSPFGAEKMCLVEIATPAPETQIML